MSNPKHVMMGAGKHDPDKQSREFAQPGMIEEMISKIFTTRNLTHFAHWRTNSYAKHMALGDLYDEIIDLVDEIVEVYQGKFGLIPSLSVASASMPDNVLGHVESEAQWIGANRSGISSGCEAVGALLDTLDAAYLKTIYKLKNLS